MHAFTISHTAATSETNNYFEGNTSGLDPGLDVSWQSGGFIHRIVLRTASGLLEHKTNVIFTFLREIRDRICYPLLRLIEQAAGAHNL
jgi:hypothetical protein